MQWLRSRYLDASVLVLVAAIGAVALGPSIGIGGYAESFGVYVALTAGAILASRWLRRRKVGGR